MTILFFMQPGKASKTAQYMAFFRALETEQSPTRRLFNDPYAFILLSGPLRVFARLARLPILGSVIRGILELGWPYTRSSGVVRTRAIDDLVGQGVHRGACQLVLLGAGFDSRGYRLQEALNIAVFEVDHPATQQTKKERLHASIGQLPANTGYIAVDFETDNLEVKLTEAGYDPASPAVVVWEGVISYLTEAAVQRTLVLLSRLLAPGSWLIFTYMHKGAVDGSRTFPGARRWRSWVSFNGEPFVYGFDPDTLADRLKPLGFLLRSDTSTADIAQRYCPPLGRKEPGSPAYRVATAARVEM
jgi:methyltransferase (TIGR00027 family)